MSFNTAGFIGLYSSETFSFSLSAASVYCVRSFVPILKKSTCPAKLSAIMAAEGISTIMPVFMQESKASPLRLSSALQLSSTPFASLSSPRLLIIGNIICILPKAEARRIALSCGLNMPVSLRQSLMARRPRKGFDSFGRLRYGRLLSPPMSRVRMVSGLPSSIWAAFL